MPSLSSVRTLSTCCFLVSGFLTDTTQQIHSLRASGVISSHFSRAAGSEIRVFRKSAGILCTVPLEIPFGAIALILSNSLGRCASMTSLVSTSSSWQGRTLSLRFSAADWEAARLDFLLLLAFDHVQAGALHVEGDGVAEQPALVFQLLQPRLGFGHFLGDPKCSNRGMSIPNPRRPGRYVGVG